MVSVQLILTYSMEQSPSWEANWFAASQEIPRILWNPKVPHRTHKWPPPVPILSQLHPVPTTPSKFLKIHLNINLPSTSWSPQWLFPSGFPTNTPCTPLSSPIRVICPAHLIHLDFTTRTILGKEYRSFSSSLWCTVTQTSSTEVPQYVYCAVQTEFWYTVQVRFNLSKANLFWNWKTG